MVPFYGLNLEKFSSHSNHVKCLISRS